MDETTRQRIFDPFFTTKITGSGLGLAATLGIMHRHQGGIRLLSNPGVGTTFQLFFPRSAKRVEDIQETEPQDLSGHGVILVVDDDDFVLQAAQIVLKNFGYHVLVADHGHKAVELYRRRRHDIDLVVLDMTMPGLGGEATFHALRQIDPHVKVLLSTAYDEAEVPPRFTARNCVGFLHKPYEPERLAAQVKHLLGYDAPEQVAADSDSELLTLQATFRRQLPDRLAELATAVHTARAAPTTPNALQTAYRLAHMLKGTSGSYGLEDFAAVMAHIEQKLKQMLAGQTPANDADWASVNEHLEQARQLLLH
jgi:CheY-like chemotaxis protein